MDHWSGITAAPTNLRLYEPVTGWLQHDDRKDTDGRVTSSGSQRQIDMALTGALNAGNLLLLAGAGASFCATNPVGRLSPPNMSDLWDAVEFAATPGMMGEVVSLIPSAANIVKNIEKLLSLSKVYIAIYTDDNARRTERFIRIAEQAILERVDFLDENTDLSSHRNLIRKLARRGIRKPRTKVFTTNYDLCFEQAAQQQQFVLIDGFSHSMPQIYDRAHFSYDIVRRDRGQDAPDYIENVFHLYKLHGSVDWRRNGTTILRSRSATDGEPVLIYPRDTKFQEAFEPPYLDMMSALQTALREPDTALLSSGYGFNDDHISKPIMAAIEANLSLRMIVCDIAFVDDTALAPATLLVEPAVRMRSHNPYLTRFQHLVNQGDKRLTLINGRFEDLALAIPDLVAQTERERHAERILRLHESNNGRSVP